MALSNRNPRPRARPGARKYDLLALICSENTPPHHTLQVRRLVDRFGLDRVRAELIARLAYVEVR
jgi:hypothetical protein